MLAEAFDRHDIRIGSERVLDCGALALIRPNDDDSAVGRTGDRGFKFGACVGNPLEQLPEDEPRCWEFEPGGARITGYRTAAFCADRLCALRHC
ncbi:hypothetical protein C448_04234 [Halococcus morrhuae DSM 1307]|uniref:Uncharacterized protein n=1 Tax=Halococcus morrhuae DSM 1307 TaxID=931277 RepID=M0MUF9_HALMO|nr:hypothetical protein C448_04234 [Halococcus morrhuae DSM 1307]